MDAIEPLTRTYEETRKRLPWWRRMFYSRAVSHLTVLNRILAQRPPVWGVGLWPDPESEKIAKRLAESISEFADVPKPAFIPADLLSVINGLEDEWGAVSYLLIGVEGLYGCKIDMEELLENPKMTFGDFVQIVKSRKTKSPSS